MMKRSTLIVYLLVAMVATMAAINAAQASAVSHGLGELDKLVRGETWTTNYPGFVLQVTEYNLQGAQPGLDKRPHPDGAHYLKGVMVEFAITFLTGDYEGRPGQVMFSGEVAGFTVDNYTTDGAHDFGGMNLLTTFPKDTKRIRFFWNTAGYETGSYTFLVENFPRSKRQQYSEVPIPVFLAGTKEEVSAALANADNETLKRYGLRRLSQVVQARKTPAWTGDINLSDGAVLRTVVLPRTPEVGMAIAIIDGYTVVGGGIVKSVNGGSCSIDMTSQTLRGYESRIGELTAKLAYRSEVEYEVQFKAEASGVPDQVDGSVGHRVPGRKYMTLGRDPLVPGGIKREDLKPGQEIVALPFDVYVKAMRGGHSQGEGWLPAGTMVVARKVRTTDANGNYVYAWKVEAAQPCGNVHPVYFSPAAAPTPKPVTCRHEVWIPVDIPQEVTEQVSVTIDWDYTGAPVFAAKELEKLQASRPGILSVIWNLNPFRNTNQTSSEANAAAASSSSSDSTAISNPVIDIDMQQANQ